VRKHRTLQSLTGVAVSLFVVLALASSGWMTASGASNSPRSYDLVDLGGLGGSATFALDVNDAGSVTGNSRTGTTTLPLIAFHWSDGTMTEIGTLPGSNAFSRGYAINNAGIVVGESDNNSPRAFRWENGVLSDLGTLGGGTAVAHGINQSEMVVGASSNGVTSRPYVWRNGVMRDLGTLEGSASTPGRAWDISDRGDIVGVSRVSGFTSQATLWPGPNRARLGEPVRLGSLGDGERFSEAFAVSNRGWVVGRSTVTGSIEEAFLWTDSDGMVGLGNLGFNHSRANDVNERGQIVGHAAQFAGFPSFGGAAFLWENGEMWNLNDLIDPHSGWELLSAEAINSSGVIVGYGRFEGQTRSFLLMPRS
jgi:probable HAF family extracellular repeat protein